MLMLKYKQQSEIDVVVNNRAEDTAAIHRFDSMITLQQIYC